MKTTFPLTHIWTVVCSRSSVDIDSNNISLFNLIEKLTFPISVEQLKEAHDQGKQGIFFPIEFEVVTRYRRANETQSDAMDARLRLINPEGKMILSPDEKNALKKGNIF